MSKLYIFGIGGTGSRVLKALTMLLATGVKIEASEIVPIIIDPDHAAADLSRTVKAMREYTKIHNTLKYNSTTNNQFFNTKINLEIIPKVTMPLHRTADVTFRDYIDMGSMNGPHNGYDANYALASMLFSDSNLSSKMDVGFKGNPNIGSIVLNQFASSDDFKTFASTFQQGDRIFVISSIFGGTGASGFPLLVKNLRTISNTIPGCGNVKNAPIGAITVMPYFDVAPDHDGKSQIDASTFISKTKAALSYYDRNMSEVNSLYYIADEISKQYNNSEGGSTQRNDAHFVELASALSIIDFCKIPDDELKTTDGVPDQPSFKEFGIKECKGDIIFGDLYPGTLQGIQKPMTQFVLFCKYMREQLNSSLKQTWAVAHQFDHNYINGTFYRSDLTSFRESFWTWMTEMSTNVRAFNPFNLEASKSDLFSLVKGIIPAKVMKLPSNYALYDDYLNTVQSKLNKDSNKESRFVELFHKATTEIVKDKLRMN